MPRPRKLNPVHPNPPGPKHDLPPHVAELLAKGDPAIEQIAAALTVARLHGQDPLDPAVFLWAVGEGRACYAEMERAALAEPA